MKKSVWRETGIDSIEKMSAIFETISINFWSHKPSNACFTLLNLFQLSYLNEMIKSLEPISERLLANNGKM